MRQRMDSASQIWAATTRCCALDWRWLAMKGEILLTFVEVLASQ
jgi:hypothetical protein